MGRLNRMVGHRLGSCWLLFGLEAEIAMMVGVILIVEAAILMMAEMILIAEAAILMMAEWKT